MFCSARTRAQSEEAKAFSISRRRCDPILGIVMIVIISIVILIIVIMITIAIILIIIVIIIISIVNQVQNLTPQLVNAGTIKMTYPENKVLIRMIMMIRMIIKD